MTNDFSRILWCKDCDCFHGGCCAGCRLLCWRERGHRTDELAFSVLSGHEDLLSKREKIVVSIELHPANNFEELHQK